MVYSGIMKMGIKKQEHSEQKAAAARHTHTHTHTQSTEGHRERKQFQTSLGTCNTGAGGRDSKGRYVIVSIEKLLCLILFPQVISHMHLCLFLYVTFFISMK